MLNGKLVPLLVVAGIVAGASAIGRSQVNASRIASNSQADRMHADKFSHDPAQRAIAALDADLKNIQREQELSREENRSAHNQLLQAIRSLPR